MSNCNENKKNIIAYPEDIVIAAATLAIMTTKGRTQYEVETLINLFSLTTDNMKSILAQKLINSKTVDVLETPL